MALINTEILPFEATAFHNGEFVEVTDGTGTVFTFDADDDGVSGVIWIEPSEVDPTTEGI